MPLLLNLNCLPDWVPSGILTLASPASERMHAHFGAKDRLDHRDGDTAKQIGALALKKGMRLRRNENVKIAGRTALGARLAFAAEPDSRSVLNTGRNIDGETALPCDTARTATGWTWVVDDLAASMAMRTSPFDRKKSLLRAHTSMAAAGRAVSWFRAWFGARTGTCLTNSQSGQSDGCGLSVKCLFESNFHIVAEVRSTRGSPASAAAPASHHIAEEIVENIGHGSSEPVASGPKTAMLESGMTIAVISRPLLRIGQDLIGFVQFLELDFGVRIAGVPVGMALHRRFAESGFISVSEQLLETPRIS